MLLRSPRGHTVVIEHLRWDAPPNARDREVLFSSRCLPRSNDCRLGEAIQHLPSNNICNYFAYSSKVHYNTFNAQSERP